jgi:hypothetical protein
MKRELTSGTTDGPSWFNRMKGKLGKCFIVLNQPQEVVTLFSSQIDLQTFLSVFSDKFISK